MLVLKNGSYVTEEEEQTSENVLLSYEERVVSFIREQYSLDEELSIQRQRDTKPEEFKRYFAYCEECKQRAKVL